MRDDRLQRTEVSAADWSMGPANAAVTVLEYGDFECPFSAAAAPVLEALVAEYRGALRLVYRHFPIATQHRHAELAAEAAEAAGAQGRFWEMHDLLFRYQRQLELEYLVRYAARVGCDIARLEADLRSGAYREEVRRDFRRGITDGVNGTPTLFIERRRYDGPRDHLSLSAAIGSLLQERPSRTGAPRWARRF